MNDLEDMLCFNGRDEGLLGFPSGTSVKNLPANAGDVRDVGSISGSRRSLEEGMAIDSGIHAWRIPRTEEPGHD